MEFMDPHFLVLHFGFQCPWTTWSIGQAQLAADRTGGTLDVVDVMAKPDLAEEHHLFFPFLTVINQRLRLPSPTQADTLARLARFGPLNTKPTQPQTPVPAATPERIHPLGEYNYEDACLLCHPGGARQGRQAKGEWLSYMQAGLPRGALGYVAYRRESPVGVVEFLPANLVPYPLPEKRASYALITCIYGLARGPDYRAALLERLFTHLAEHGYERVQAVAGRRSAFPNGPLPFFLANGFSELFVIDQVLLNEGWEELVLVEKPIY